MGGFGSRCRKSGVEVAWRCGDGILKLLPTIGLTKTQRQVRTQMTHIKFVEWWSATASKCASRRSEARYTGHAFCSVPGECRRPAAGIPLARAAALAAFTAAAIAVMACSGSSTSPSRLDLSGHWNGTGSYPNAPFQLMLTQTGTTLRGSYSDRHDTSLSVHGTLVAGVMTIAIDFGDAQLHLEGTVENSERVRGTMRTSALGNTPYAFTMNR